MRLCKRIYELSARPGGCDGNLVMSRRPPPKNETASRPEYSNSSTMGDELGLGKTQRNLQFIFNKIFW
jgi:hypothetical protein